MWELIKSGGWLMAPILLCSVGAMAIVLERLWSLQKERVCPEQLLVRVRQWLAADELSVERVRAIRQHSPLGQILAAGLQNMHHDREIIKEAIEDTGRQVVHDLERYLNTLGTIAAITPLLGLLGTVIGMIDVFAVITEQGVGDPTVLSAGIAKALITTAAGLSVAIPALIFHRYLSGRVGELVLRMEDQALQLVEVIHGEREPSDADARQAA